MSYAANLGRDRITRMLYDLGARALEQALDRAGLQSQIETAAMLSEMLGKPAPPDGALDGAAYTLSVPDTEFVLRRGFQSRQGAGTPVETVIGSDSRRPADKRRILALYEEHGYMYPGTAVMAFHRGRFDLLEQHLARDPQLLSRLFAIGRSFRRKSAVISRRTRRWVHLSTAAPCCTWRCTGMSSTWRSGCWTAAPIPMRARPWTPTASAAIRRSLVPSCRRRASGSTIRASSRRRPATRRFTELLLSRGADPNMRASIRMRLGEGHGDTRIREFRDVTPLSWGRRFSLEQVPGKHREILFVNAEAMRVLEAHGGHD